VTARTITRAAFLASLMGAATLAVATPAFAARNADAEQYIQTNASSAMRTLADRSIPAATREQAFNRLMADFTDMPRIASFVLGVHGRQLRTDAALRADWNRVFQEYATAVYEDQLDRYRGSTIRVTGSVERVPGRDIIVASEIVQRTGRAIPAQWRLLRTGNSWKVVDVSLLLEGNEIWLAQQQQRDFLAVLDRNNGNIRTLIVEVEAMISRMRQRAIARG
jgi:ABC-type transporter MlaC component